MIGKCAIDPEHEAATVSWECRSGGNTISLCQECQDNWRARVAASPGLANRCPRCAQHWEAVDAERAAVPALAPARRALLANLDDMTLLRVSLAVDTAMAAEGLLIDVRQRVISRLSTGDPQGLAPSSDTTSHR